MDNKESIIKNIEEATQTHFNNNEIQLALKSYRELLNLFPNDKVYYVIYLDFLQEEFVIVELLWKAYEEALACCGRAIADLDHADAEYFYMKKLELYVTMIDSNFKWSREHQIEVQSNINESLQKYPNNTEIMKRIMAIYRLMGNAEKENEILNIAYEKDPNDFLLVLFKTIQKEKQGDFTNAINIIENWIQINPISQSIDTAYLKIISLCEKTNNQDKIDFYQDILDNK